MLNVYPVSLGKDFVQAVHRGYFSLFHLIGQLSQFLSGSGAGSHIGGNLVGPGTGPNPISGAVVDFSFDHGTGNPVVHGVGGADLR